MSGAEAALQSAIVAALAADTGVKTALGEPLRLLEIGSPLPGYPHLEEARMQSQPTDAAGFEGVIVTVDLAVSSRDEGGRSARAAIAEVRRALGVTDIVIEGWRCVLMLPVFSDAVREAIGRWRAILQVRVIVERES